MRPVFKLHRRAIAISAIGLAVAGIARAQTPEPFYKGKTLSISIPADPGGSYDLYARLVATYLVKYLPGAPAAVVQNMPGAGGLRAINYLYSVAPKDGTFLQVPAQDVALSEALGRDGVEFKVVNFNWIGRVAPSVDITTTWHTSNVNTIEDAKKREVTLAATGPNSPTSVNPTALNALIGTRFKIISGYKSNAEMSMAMERGETDGAFSTWATLKTSFPGWLRDKKVNRLVAYTTERTEELKDVPAVTELASNDGDRRILALIASTGTLGRSLIATPGIDPARARELRAAFDAMVKDAAFLAEIKKLDVEFGPLSGAEMEGHLKDIFDSPPEIIARARQILRETVKR